MSDEKRQEPCKTCGACPTCGHQPSLNTWQFRPWWGVVPPAWRPAPAQIGPTWITTAGTTTIIPNTAGANPPPFTYIVYS